MAQRIAQGELQGTPGNSRELQRTPGNSRELQGTPGTSKGLHGHAVHNGEIKEDGTCHM